MATRVSKITGVFLLLLINLATSCNKNKLVYYTPSNASKQSVALAEINKVDVVDLILIDTINRIDSPITNDTEKNKAILKKYSFGDETIENKQQEKNNQAPAAVNKKKGRYTVLITGIVILAIGLLWLLYTIATTSSSGNLDGCIPTFFSLILSIIGLVTTIFGLFTS